MKPSLLAKAYLSELTHVHTVVSNHPGHIESDLTQRKLLKELYRSKLTQSKGGPIEHVIITEHTSDSSSPHELPPISDRSIRLFFQPFFNLLSNLDYGMEVSLLVDGSIDASESLIKQRPIVIASRHRLPAAFEKDVKKVTKLMLNACDNPSIDVLGHPARNFESLELDWKKVFDRAAKKDTGIEININTYPKPDNERALSFWGEWLAILAASDAKITIGSDIHTVDQLKTFTTGVRRMLRGREDTGIWGRGLRAVADAGIKPDRIKRLHPES